MTADLFREVYMRSRGRCECGCGASVAVRGEFDHFFGRAKAEENAATVWLLTVACHRAKTDNKPSAALWLLKFIKHAGRHGFDLAAERAQQRLEFVTARGATA